MGRRPGRRSGTTSRELVLMDVWQSDLLSVSSQTGRLLNIVAARRRVKGQERAGWTRSQGSKVPGFQGSGFPGSGFPVQRSQA